ncbi:MAG: c-type cytochrome [Candidatus Omnitrophica bacterium]|nr:hypothetical protein [bacterium]NUN96776.1 c-type cytochrome [Candidatus Omnitrophota bacterium]
MNHHPKVLIGFLSLGCVAPPSGCADVTSLFRVPEGFAVTEFADQTLADDIFCMTIDPKGRLVAAGRGYIRILADDDQDGRADRAIPFAEESSDGAQGLFWDGDSLLFSGDGGLRVVYDRDGDDRADSPSELIREILTGDEHGAHAIRRGPEGWLYLIGGNHARIGPEFAELVTSPIKKPIGGALIRFTPDLKHTEIVADGFRNPYDFDFGSNGEIYTFDSDNERDVSLPFYEGMRLYSIVEGGHYGWRNPRTARTWRFPPCFFDGIAPLADLARGSPTGVERYRHTRFPDKYHGGLFLLDWTFGIVFFVPSSQLGLTPPSAPEVFLEVIGNEGFAPTDLVVQPQSGDLYISIGGRGTRGAVYRVSYTAGKTSTVATESDGPKVVRHLEWREDLFDQVLSQATQGDAWTRLHALEALLRFRDRFPSEARTAAIQANWGRPERPIRWLCAKLIHAMEPDQVKDLSEVRRNPAQELTYCWGIHTFHPNQAAERAIPHLGKQFHPEVRLAAVRLLQVILGDLMAESAMNSIWEGYSRRADPRQSDPPLGEPVRFRILEALVSEFPSGSAEMDRELARALAIAETDSPHALAAVAAKLDLDSSPVEDIHYLAVLARLRAPRSSEITTKTVSALLALERKCIQGGLNRETSWPLRVGELAAGLAESDPAFAAALLASPDLGDPGHAIFAKVPGLDTARFAEVFLSRADSDPEYLWSPELVEVVARLHTERAFPILRDKWSRRPLQAAILRALAAHPVVEDSTRFLEGLRSPDPQTALLCLRALESFKLTPNADLLAGCLLALRKLADGKQWESVRKGICALLGGWTGEEGVECSASRWEDLLLELDPSLRARLESGQGMNIADWRARLAKIDWESGDAARGEEVYTRIGCASCHSQGKGIGPDLRGVSRRFSREDLFTAILDPSRDVSSQYRTVLVETASGDSFQGAVIYEAKDSLILQTGADTTVRVLGDEVVEKRDLETSLMPTGLLDPLTDAEIGDLGTYLRGLEE